MASGNHDVDWWLRKHSTTGGVRDSRQELIRCQEAVLHGQLQQAADRVASWADRLDALQPSTPADARLWVTAMWKLDEARLVDLRIQLAVLAEVAMVL